MFHLLLQAYAVLLLLLVPTWSTIVSGQLTDAQIEEVLAAHNRYRSEAGATNMLRMVYSEELAEIAQTFTNTCPMQFNTMRNSQSPTFSTVGENLLTIIGSSPLDATAAVDSWGAQRGDFNIDTNSCFAVCGSYTQIVWAQTEFIGCGFTNGADCGGAGVFICDYGPSGNIIGQPPYNNIGAVCSECPAGRVCQDNLCTEAPPIPLEICFVDDTPDVNDRMVTVRVEANQPVESITCFFNGRRETDCTGGVAVFRVPYTTRTYQYHYLRVVARTATQTKTMFRLINAQPPFVCTVNFLEKAIRVVGPGSVRVNFVGNGRTQRFRCLIDTDRSTLTMCNNGRVFRGLSPGRHRIRITPMGPCRRRKPIEKFFRV